MSEALKVVQAWNTHASSWTRRKMRWMPVDWHQEVADFPRKHHCIQLPSKLAIAISPASAC